MTVHHIMQKHIPQIDFLRCVFIVLMVLFHLVYIGDSYPMAKQVVYTFHMPGFLLISGFLSNTDKPLKAFARQLLWLMVPYMVMEAGYTVMASLLPIREHIDRLTLGVLLEKLFLAPLGPYWYLHTLMVCYVVNDLLHGTMRKFFPKVGLVSQLCVMGAVFWWLSSAVHLLDFSNALYFMAGVLVRRSGAGFLSVFRASWLALLPLVLLVLFTPADSLHRFTIQGFAITWLVMCFLLSAAQVLPLRWHALAAYIGSNTLPILLFSPIFTVLVKPLVGVFSFDASGVLFALVAVPLCISGSFAIAWLMDKCGASRWFSGRPLLR